MPHLLDPAYTLPDGTEIPSEMEIIRRNYFGSYEPKARQFGLSDEEGNLELNDRMIRRKQTSSR